MQTIDITGIEHEVLCLLEDAELDVLPVGAKWTVSDPEAAGYVLGDGPTLYDAVAAALPIALAEYYIDRREIAALLDSSEPGLCGVCRGCGEGRGGPHTTCYACRGTGIEVQA